MIIGLAPMEGVLDPLLRRVLSGFCQIDICTTEFVRVTSRKLPSHVFYKKAPELFTQSKTESGVPVLVQLLGGDPNCIAENASVAKSLGAHGIDLNFGCPARTVNRHDGGATLLKSPDRLFKVITAVKKSLDPQDHVSAKVRLGFSDKSLVTEIALACSEAQATWLTVHGRTKEEGYKPFADWKSIGHMKSVSSIPVFANGDIWCLEDYKRCKEESGCPDVMIGRGLVRRPHLAQEIKENKIYAPEKVEKELLFLIESYAKDGTFLYGEKGTLNRVKQWIRMISYPSNPFWEKLFEKIKGAQSLDVALDCMRQYSKKH